MNKIKIYRNKAGMTIQKLSTESGVSVGYLSELENDAKGIKNPSRKTMSKISGALNKTISEIFFPDELDKAV